MFRSAAKYGCFSAFAECPRSDRLLKISLWVLTFQECMAGGVWELIWAAVFGWTHGKGQLPELAQRHLLVCTAGMSTKNCGVLWAVLGGGKAA